MRIANLSRDALVIHQVRNTAIDLLADDPTLAKAQNKPIVDTLRMLQSGKGIWKYIS
jgi:hypothetical protein